MDFPLWATKTGRGFLRKFYQDLVLWTWVHFILPLEVLTLKQHLISSQICTFQVNFLEVTLKASPWGSWLNTVRNTTENPFLTRLNLWKTESCFEPELPELWTACNTDCLQLSAFVHQNAELSVKWLLKRRILNKKSLYDEICHRIQPLTWYSTYFNLQKTLLFDNLGLNWSSDKVNFKTLARSLRLLR